MKAGVLILCVVIILIAIVAVYQFGPFKRSSQKLKQKQKDHHDALERRNSENKPDDKSGATKH